MTIKRLTASDFVKLFRYASFLLKKNCDNINELNVFPVPDGDTGTNMSLTFDAGYKSIKDKSFQSVSILLQEFSKGLLMGARGNSGVILSQIFAGFSKGINQKETIEIEDFAIALKEATKSAYDAVVDPVEGTILTVVRETAEKSVDLNEEATSFITFFEELLNVANASLLSTKNTLPILQEANVVDSGGKGFVVILEAFLQAVRNEPIEIADESTSSIERETNEKNITDFTKVHNEISYGYCTEFIIQLNDIYKNSFDEKKLRKKYMEEGDSLVVVHNDDLVKVHLHTEYPGNSLNIAQEYGSLMDVKIDNMRKQYEAFAEEKKYGILAVSSGEGNASLFKQLGVDRIIEGGQTMNPSVQTFVDMIKNVNAKHIIILPNNKNIIMAALEAKQLSEKDITVIPTKSIQEGLIALFSFNIENNIDDNEAEMNNSLNSLKTGSISRAVRDTNINQLQIKTNDYIGLKDEALIIAEKDEKKALFELLRQLIHEGAEILTLLIGKDAKLTKSDLEKEIQSKFSEIEIEIFEGNQEVYPYLLAVE